MSITAADIKKVVYTEDDFGHEMRVGSALNTLNYAISSEHSIENPIHGETYEDPKTQKTRQFDFRCKIVNGYPPRQIISMAIECKNLNPDFPLVVCGRLRTARESYHIVIRPHDGKPTPWMISNRSSIYRPNEFVGKSILRLKIKERKLCSDGDSEIYDRWSQALASSHDLGIQAARDSQPTSSTFIMPMVVVPDGALWMADYDKEGKLVNDPQQVAGCEFHVAHRMLIGLPYLITHIHFVTLGGLRALISELVKFDCYKWDRIFSIDGSEFKEAP